MRRGENLAFVLDMMGNKKKPLTPYSLNPQSIPGCKRVTK